MYRVHHRVSSSYNPHSNLRAETGVKPVERLLQSLTSSDGSQLWSEIYQALLQYRNTPIAVFGVSPARLLFGRRVKDLLPIKPGLPNNGRVLDRVQGGQIVAHETQGQDRC